ncbi:MAG: choice-of-anchor D domain-containing protein [Lentisphaerae bacterium]|nr:MAG: choice-of-anchor D domain-containing protein [Lentisphaerota bacterium]
MSRPHNATCPIMATLLAIGIAGSVAFGGNAIVPGKLYVDPPTQQSLGVRWYYSGDANHNASVEVTYRLKGSSQWLPAQKLHRIHNEIAAGNSDNPYPCGYLFAGSVMFLQPDTAYEVRLKMQDPDGGAAPPQLLNLRTAKIPMPYRKGRQLHVYPQATGCPDTFTTINAAYAKAQPGDVIVIHAGVYTEKLVCRKQAIAEKPIAFIGAGDGEVIWQYAEGDTKNTLIDLGGCSYHYFENIHFRGAKHLMEAGVWDMNKPGAVGITVKNCRFTDFYVAINSWSKYSREWYIADCTFRGRKKKWYYPGKWSGIVYEDSHSGVILYGQANVLRNNEVSYVGDGLSIANHGKPPSDVNKQAIAWDFLQNDIHHCGDDFMETDYAQHNVRVYENRMVQAFSGLSVQPAYGGPIYLIRNLIAGSKGALFKFHYQPVGIYAWHNTLIGAVDGFKSDVWQSSHLRNNLFFGSGYALNTGTMNPAVSTMDYNGYYQPHPGENFIRWKHYEDGLYKTTKEFASLAAFTAFTGYEKHGIMVDFSIFRKDFRPVEGVTFSPEDIDYRLKAGAVAIDKGCRLENVNDNAIGAPDLGCYEYGLELPHYGPRKQDSKNLPPFCIMLAPITDTVLRTDEKFRVKIDATDRYGSISKVEIRLDGKLLATEYHAPYERTLTITVPGHHRLSAIAYDNDGLSASSTNTIDLEVRGPDIDVEGHGKPVLNGTTLPSPDNHTDFGIVIPGTAVEHIFTLRNRGNETLVLKTSPAVRIVEEGTTSFCISRQPDRQLAPGETTSFSIQALPTQSGEQMVQVRIDSNDADENPFLFTIKVTGNLPPVAVTDGSATSGRVGEPVLLSGSGSHDPDDYPQPLSWQWSQISGPELVSLANANGMEARFSPATPGTYVFELTVNDGAADDTSRVTVQVEKAQSTIVISGNGQTIVNGDDSPATDDGTDFGQVSISDEPPAHTFHIHNAGTAELRLEAWSVDPPFTVKDMPSSIPPDTVATFTIVFSPTEAKVYHATFQLSSNAPSGQYTFSLCGEGIAPPPSQDGGDTDASGGSSSASDSGGGCSLGMKTGSPGWLLPLLLTGCVFSFVRSNRHLRS